MPTWAKVLVVVPVAFCIGCGALGVFVVWPHVKSEATDGWLNVADEMTEAVDTSVARRIRASDLTPNGADGHDDLLLREADINVNNANAGDQVGIEYSPEGTRVFGIETRIDSSRIAIVLPSVTYSAVPAVQDGRVELTSIESDDDLLGFLFTRESFERAIEDGVNGALHDAGWVPVSLSLRSGLMTIEIAPVACLVGGSASGGCDAATPSA